ncbi:MAG: GAF domain-containing protein [Reichenbachiella sp.]
MGYKELQQKYINGKQVISLVAVILTIVGFILDGITYYSIYSSIQIRLQIFFVALFVIALVLHLIDRNKYYIYSFGIISYGVIFNIIFATIFIHTFESFEKFTEANIISRDIFFVFLYIALSGFILGKAHLFIQGIQLIGLIFYLILVKKNSFFLDNGLIYIVSTVGFIITFYFFVGTLESLIKGLKSSYSQSNKLQLSEHNKNQNLINYQQKLLQLHKELPSFEGNLDELLEKICSTAAKNLFINRVSVWVLEGDNAVLVRKHLFESNKSTKKEVFLHQKDYPIYFKSILENSFILANDVSDHADTVELKKSLLNDNDVTSILDCPIIIDGKTYGVICCENQHEIKNWSAEDVLFVQSLSEYVSLAYKNQKIKLLLEQVSNQNIELLEKTNEIEDINDELNKVNNELSNINSNLDDTVKKRTEELELQNLQLTEYAFINSHLLRAPLSRILGLSKLMSAETATPENKELIVALNNSSSELDEIIRKINDILYDGNSLSRDDVQKIIDKKTYSKVTKD